MMKEGNPMNPDECRKAFEAWAEKIGTGIGVLNYEIWQAAWNSRAESKPVTREACGHDIVDSWRKTSEPIWDDIETAQGEWKRLSDMIDAELSRRIEALQLSAPQSPVVPGVEELSRVFMKGARSNWTKPDNPHDADDQPLSIDDGVKAIHAHLLATGGRESREDRYREALVAAERWMVEKGCSHEYAVLKMVRNAIANGAGEWGDDALKKELDDLQRKAFNEFVDMANRYRRLLERVKGRLEAMECDDWIGYTEIVEALATTSPNDSSGRG